MPESRPPIELRGLNLADLQKLIEERRLPPVDQWNPEHCGHSGMRIARDGTWYHEGTPIRRPAMVRLFSTVLRREPDGRRVLAPPAEMCEFNAEVEAAVLIAITDRPEAGVILTVRREHLRTHAGQIAFPGGRIDPGEDAIVAALREANEEVLLPADAVEVVGAIEPYRTVTGYVVTPVISVIPPDLALEPHEHEVADW